MATAIQDPDEIEDGKQQYIEQLFDYYDSNGDGYIDRFELTKYLVALCESRGLSTDRVYDNMDRIMATYDRDHDNRLSRKEAIEFVMSRPNY